jgi:hypothetical protein
VPDPRWQATIPGMATVQYESKENAGRKFWTGCRVTTPSGSTPAGPASTGGSSPWRAAQFARGRSNRDEAAAAAAAWQDTPNRQQVALAPVRNRDPEGSVHHGIVYRKEHWRVPTV